MLNVSGSMSTNTGVAPTLWIVPAVAKNVNGVVTTSSPRPMSSARSASSSASVPFAQPIACFVCESSATDRSSAPTGVAEDEQLRVDDAHHRGDDVVADRGVLRLEVEQRNGHVDRREAEGSSGAVPRQSLRAERERHLAAGLRRLVDAEDQLERLPAGAPVGVRRRLAAQHRRARCGSTPSWPNP